MGNSTVFWLNITLPPDEQDLDTTSIIDRLRTFSDGADDALDKNGSNGDSCKWDDHHEDMMAFSKFYPDVLFTLQGKPWMEKACTTMAENIPICGKYIIKMANFN